MVVSREAFLCKGGVDAHGYQFDHVVQALILLAQIVGLLFAHWGVERRHDADDPNLTLALCISDGDQRQVSLCQIRLPERVADFNTGSREGQEASLVEDRMAFTSHGTAVSDGNAVVRNVGAASAPVCCP